MFGMLKRWLGKKFKLRSAPACAAQLPRPLSRGLEPLEARDNPAAFYYSPLGSDHLSTNPVNFLLDSPLGVRAAPNSPPPGPNDHIYLRATTSGNANLVVPLGQTTVPPPPEGAPPTPVPGNTYAGIHLIDSYTGTVQLQKSLAIGTLVLASPGSIWQNDLTVPGYAGDLWVKSAFTWTAGTLNSGTVPGGVTLAGATGLAAPSTTTPVYLGSTITLAPNLAGLGSTLEVLKGTYNLVRGEGFVVREQCQVQIKPDPTLDAPVTMDATTLNSVKDSIIRVAQGGSVTFKPANRPATNTTLAKFDAKGNKAAIGNNGGTVSVEDRTEVKLPGKMLIVGQPADGEWSLIQLSGTTKIETGSRLIADHGTYVKGGELQVVPLIDKSTGQPAATQPPDAYLGGKSGLFTLELTGTGKLWMPGLYASNPYLKLTIDGDWNWTDGVVSLSLHPSATDRCDKIDVKGKVTVVNTPDLEVRWPGYETEMRQVGRLTSWELVTSVDGITGDVTRVYGDPQTQVTMDVNRVSQNKKLQAQKTN